MPNGTSVTWKQVGAIVAGATAAMGAVATIHALLVVPAILDAARIQAQEVARKEVEDVRSLIEGHLRDVEVIRANLVTKAELEAVVRQLDRIEARLGR